MDKLSTDKPSGDQGGRNKDLVAYVILAAVVFVSYGYELFNFNLTIDEETHAIRGGRLHLDWISQGRWGAALLNYFVLQNPIIPAVSASLGLAGTVAGLFIYLKKAHSFDQLGLAAAVALAVTVPTLAFTYTFSTLAYGIGFAFLAIAASSKFVHRPAWWALALACLLGAFAISVYQTFFFVLAMLAWAAAVDSFGRTKAGRVNVYWKPLAYVVGSVAIYLFVNYIALELASQDVRYIGQFIDLKGLIDDPLSRGQASLERVFQILNLRPELFGEQSLWLGLTLLVSIVFSITFPLLRRQYAVSLRAGTIALGILAIMVLADAITPRGAPIRSVIYVPVGVAIIFATAYMQANKVVRRLLLSLSVLAIIGNSMINNHLFASSAAAEYKDRVLAHTIIKTARELKAEAGGGTSLFKVELVGQHAWAETPIQSRTETFGASFFEWDAGNRRRVAAYLSLNGLPAVAATDEDRIRLLELINKMPVWPNEGWITLSGDVLLIKFGEHSGPQRRSLCTQGATQLCD